MLAVDTHTFRTHHLCRKGQSYVSHWNIMGILIDLHVYLNGLANRVLPCCPVLVSTSHRVIDGVQSYPFVAIFFDVYPLWENQNRFLFC